MLLPKAKQAKARPGWFYIHFTLLYFSLFGLSQGHHGWRQKKQINSVKIGAYSNPVGLSSRPTFPNLTEGQLSSSYIVSLLCMILILFICSQIPVNFADSWYFLAPLPVRKPKVLGNDDIKDNYSRYITMQGGVFEISGPYFLRVGVEFGSNTSRAPAREVFEPNSTRARKKYGFINNECIGRSRGFGCQIS